MSSQSEWRKRNLEKVRENARKYARNNRKKMNEYKKRDFEKNKEKRIEARYLRNKIYWDKPENKERRRLNHLKIYSANLVRFAKGRHISEIRVALKKLGLALPKGLDVSHLYDLLVVETLKDRERTLSLFKFGRPDASVIKTEFKVGFDRLCSHQFVWNILNGHDSRIRCQLLMTT